VELRRGPCLWPGKIIDAPTRSQEIVERLTRCYEGERSAELFKRWSPEFLEKMLKGIVAFEIKVTRLEGKFKLGQNRSPADIASVISALTHSKGKGDNALAEFMNQQKLG
jgi:transcriptional regulator